MRKKQREETSERTEWGGVASAQKLVVETVQENVACLEERERREWALAAAAGRLCAALGALDLAERDRVDLGRVVRKEKVPETGANDEADDDVAAGEEHQRMRSERERGRSAYPLKYLLAHREASSQRARLELGTEERRTWRGA